MADEKRSKRAHGFSHHILLSTLCNNKKTSPVMAIFCIWRPRSRKHRSWLFSLGGSWAKLFMIASNLTGYLDQFCSVHSVLGRSLENLELRTEEYAPYLAAHFILIDCGIVRKGHSSGLPSSRPISTTSIFSTNGRGT